MNKKAEWKIQPGIAIFFGIIAFIIITMWVGSWQCKNDNDCGLNGICTVRHICYQAPVIQNTIIKTENKFTIASLILGICIIIAAYILKNNNFIIKKKSNKL